MDTGEASSRRATDVAKGRNVRRKTFRQKRKQDLRFTGEHASMTKTLAVAALPTLKEVQLILQDLTSKIMRLESAEEAMGYADMDPSALLVIMTSDVESDFSLRGVAHTSTLISAVMKVPMIVMTALRAPASNVSVMHITYVGTPNTRSYPMKTFTVTVDENSKSTGACHVACPLTTAVLDRGYWCAYAVMRAYQTTSPFLHVCPCKWNLNSLPQWVGYHLDTLHGFGRRLDYNDKRKICTLTLNESQVCSPYHMRRCNCQREPTGCCRRRSSWDYKDGPWECTSSQEELSDSADREVPHGYTPPNTD